VTLSEVSNDMGALRPPAYCLHPLDIQCRRYVDALHRAKRMGRVKDTGCVT
jgi:hypothetical protein